MSLLYCCKQAAQEVEQLVYLVCTVYTFLIERTVWGVVEVGEVKQEGDEMLRTKKRYLDITSFLEKPSGEGERSQLGMSQESEFTTLDSLKETLLNELKQRKQDFRWFETRLRQTETKLTKLYSKHRRRQRGNKR